MANQENTDLNQKIDIENNSFDSNASYGYQKYEKSRSITNMDGKQVDQKQSKWKDKATAKGFLKH